MKTNKVFGMFLMAALLTTIFGVSTAQANTVGTCVYKAVAPTDYAESINHWDPAETGSACVVLSFNQAGTMHVFSGWVFNAPLLMNGDEIPTHIVDGELAAQIDEVSFEVAANSSLVFEPTWSTNGTELGIRYSFTTLEEHTQTPEPTATPTEQPTEPPSSDYILYLPLVSNPPEVLKADGSIHTVQSPSSWSNSQDGQQKCVEIAFEGGHPGQIVSGWFFGTNPLFVLNDGVIAVKTRSDPHEQAAQIDSTSLTDNPLTLKVCVTAQNGAEIGLRIQY